MLYLLLFLDKSGIVPQLLKMSPASYLPLGCSQPAFHSQPVFMLPAQDRLFFRQQHPCVRHLQPET